VSYLHSGVKYRSGDALDTFFFFLTSASDSESSDSDWLLSDALSSSSDSDSESLFRCFLFLSCFLSSSSLLCSLWKESKAQNSHKEPHTEKWPQLTGVISKLVRFHDVWLTDRRDGALFIGNTAMKHNWTCLQYLALSCTGFLNSLFFFFFFSLSFSSSSSSSSSSDSEPSPLSSLSEAVPLTSLPLPLSETLAESDSAEVKLVISH